MLPKVIIHNSISLDGSLTGFQPDMDLHYSLMGRFAPDMILVGSNTAVAGFEIFGGPPPESDKDMDPPVGVDHLPYWVLIDTRGTLMGYLHGLRSSGFCRDVMVIVSESTPSEYIEYLRKRKYVHHTLGKDRADLEALIGLLGEEYGAETIVTDAGRVLGNLLLDKGLASEISILIHPLIVGVKGYNMFGRITAGVFLELSSSELFENGIVLAVYKVLDRP
ncbi:MAG: dihydrofolate reductase family protein [Thermoplasmatota archaeon]